MVEESAITSFSRRWIEWRPPTGTSTSCEKGVRVLEEAIIKVKVPALTGVAKGERASDPPCDQPGRLSRAALGHDPGGTIGLAKVRDGLYFSSLLDPRRRASGPSYRSSRRLTSRASVSAGWRISSKPLESPR
jgi:hypothetical protein